MKSLLFAVSIIIALLLFSVFSTPAFWFAIFPLASLFPFSQRISLLGVSGALFDILSGHPLGLAFAIFIGYGMAAEVFRRSIWASASVSFVFLTLTGGGALVLFFVAQALSLRLLNVPVNVVTFATQLGYPLLALTLGTLLATAILSRSARREQTRHMTFS